MISKYEFTFFQEVNSEYWNWVKEGLDSLGRKIGARDLGEGTTLFLYKIGSSQVIFQKRMGPSTLLVESEKDECKKDLEDIINRLKQTNPNYPFRE